MVGEIGAASAAISGVPASGRLAFTALRNGAVLGSHVLTFRQTGEQLQVDIAVDYTVKFTFVTVFRYTLRATETWVGGKLMAASAHTNDNGKPEFMRATREGSGLLVQGSAVQPYKTPDGALIASHWNVAQLAAPMVNPQDGTLLTYTVTPRGPAEVPDASGVLRHARLVELVGTNPLSLYYDNHNIWTALQAKAGDGSLITYQPLL